MKFNDIEGVPNFLSYEFESKKKEYCLLIPVINEGERIINELKKANIVNVSSCVDIIICDGKSTDGSLSEPLLKQLQVNTLLVKNDSGKQGAQLRMGIYFAMERKYKGIVTIDGNNKDSIEDVSKFIDKLDGGYDFIQGSRFIKGGKAINTPLIRYLSVRLLHAPIISFTAKQKFTDTTNAFRGYSMKYLLDERVRPLRSCFVTYELLAYLSTRASQLGLKVCEIPVKREYPKNQRTPTKISLFKGNSNLLIILLKNLLGVYNI